MDRLVISGLVGRFCNSGGWIASFVFWRVDRFVVFWRVVRLVVFCRMDRFLMFWPGLSRGRGLGPGLGPGLGIGLGPCLGLGPGRGLGLGLALDQGLGLGLARAGACDIGDVLLAFLVFSVARAVMLHSALSRCFRTSIFRWLYRNCKSSVLLCEK